MNASSHAERVFRALIKNRRINRPVLRALRKANKPLGLAIGWRLAELRDSDDPLLACYSKVEENVLHATLFREVADILAARWEKVPERKRPHYTPEQRYRILRIRDLLALSSDETAKLFRLSRHTIGRWEAATLVQPEKKTIGPTVNPCPPVRRYADVVRELVQTMAWLGFGGSKLIAQTLARAGWKISPETVRRIRKELPPTNTETPTAKTPAARSVRASYPGHVWTADLTDVAGLFGMFRFKIAVILDVFSRMPLAFSVFTKEPTAQDIRILFLKAMARFGIPRHFVSDQGRQLIDSGFRQFLFGLGVRHRFGAIGKTGSIAIIERFWKQLKYTLSLRSFRPLSRIRAFLLHEHSAPSGPFRGDSFRSVSQTKTGLSLGRSSTTRKTQGRTFRDTLRHQVSRFRKDASRSRFKSCVGQRLLLHRSCGDNSVYTSIRPATSNHYEYSVIFLKTIPNIL